MVKEKIENESKESRFKRLASLRANRILNDLRLLGNCSNRRLYNYTDIEIDKIFNAIEKEVKMTKMLFQKKKQNRIEL